LDFYYFDVSFLESTQTEIQTSYKIGAGSICGFQKFVTSGSGLGFWVFKNPILGLGSGSGFENYSKKSGFGFRFGLGFVKNIKIPAKFP
jgi:hypothetical protein